jgi:ribosomal protein S14
MSRAQNKNKPLKKVPKNAGACRECGNPLTTPATVKRGMCRSCWRVARVVSA